jgi:hypothetical protein
MAHYAYIDDNNIVTQVIVGKDEGTDGVDWEEYYGAIRTSYNGKIRGNFAGIGYTYLEEFDLFMAPKCHAEAILNTETAKWDCTNKDHDVVVPH